MCSSSFPKGSRLAIADLGCASGPNTLLLMSEVIKVVNKLSRELGQECLELQIFLNDLHGKLETTSTMSSPPFKDSGKT
ncbi:unnamed protein product [Linum tenue]|uniref:Uncharacterized protein n=1 Tax=Linum tenue TaxID=586396 RepID=A0AAV0MAT8_9ROSI|nr:unnamed protein product [Linum tenue]